MSSRFFSGVFWGVVVSGLVGAAASLIHSNSSQKQTSPMAIAPAEVVAEPTAVTPQAAPVEPVVEEPAVVAPQAAPVEPVVEEPAVVAPEAAPVEPSIEETTPPEVPAQEVIAPEVAVPDSDDSAAITGTTSGDAPVSLGMKPALPDLAQVESQLDAGLDVAAMTAPVMEEAPVVQGNVDSDMSNAEVATDVQVADLPDVVIPKLPESPLPEDNPALEVLDTPPPQELEDAADSLRDSTPKIRNLAPNVKTNRLPTIGGTTEATETGQETAEADQDALVAYAMAFENPDAKPMLSVILIDDPKQPVTDDVLSHLPFALSFAIDAVRDDAQQVGARYRAAGFEVVMLTNLPVGAKAPDVEVAFDAYSRALPEAVAVLDQGTNGFLLGPSTATQIAGIMADRGMGLVTPNKGLNSAQKAAKREGVPAALIFRDLDADDEKADVIGRYLDRAAFRAAQEGSVIMLGHTNPETIEALVSWAQKNRAAKVVMAPVSAVLTAQ